MTNIDLEQRIDDVLPGVLDDLEEFVRIPSVSADPGRADQVRRSAEWVAERLREAGCPDVRLVSAGAGAPAIIARYPAPDGLPTVCLYAHHDVQPEGDPARWTSAAVPAGSSGRPAVRPRQRRRQGWFRRASGCAAGLRRQSAGRRHAVCRGRGGGRLADPRGAAGRASRRSGRRPVRHRRLVELGRRPAELHDLLARAGRLRGRGQHPRSRHPLRRLRRGGARRTDHALPAARDPARRERERRGRGTGEQSCSRAGRTTATACGPRPGCCRESGRSATAASWNVCGGGRRSR